MECIRELRSHMHAHTTKHTEKHIRTHTNTHAAAPTNTVGGTEETGRWIKVCCTGVYTRIKDTHTHAHTHNKTHGEAHTHTHTHTQTHPREWGSLIFTTCYTPRKPRSPGDSGHYHSGTPPALRSHGLTPHHHPESERQSHGRVGPTRFGLYLILRLPILGFTRANYEAYPVYFLSSAYTTRGKLHAITITNIVYGVWHTQGGSGGVVYCTIVVQ